MTREEAIQILSTRDWSGMLCGYTSGYSEALDMAIEALSKPNYESDTEVRLAVTDRNKDKVVLWDAFGKVGYYPNGEINCVHCQHYYETEDDTGVHSHCGSYGRLIDADALGKDLMKRWDINDDQDFCNKEVWEALRDAPTVPVVDITQRDLCKDISCADCPFMKGTCKLMDCVAYADRPHGEWIVNTDDSCGGITLTCSECGEQFNFDDADEVLDFKEHAHFCINCGAKMGGDKECL